MRDPAHSGSSGDEIWIETRAEGLRGSRIEKIDDVQIALLEPRHLIGYHASGATIPKHEFVRKQNAF